MATMVLVKDASGASVALVELSQAVRLWLKNSATVLQWFKDKILWIGPEINERGKRIVDKEILKQPGVHVRTEIKNGITRKIVVIRMPAVIQVLRYMKTGKRAFPAPTTENVVAYYGYQCQRVGCERTFAKNERKKLTKDHILPSSRGGTDTWENITCLCFHCNNEKGDRTLEEMNWKLLRQPSKPKTKLELQLAKHPHVPKEWIIEITE